jgi:hypothetical protein
MSLKPISSKWLVISSCTFLIPSARAFNHSFYLHCMISLCTTLFSINHWRRAECGMRRSLDRVVARGAFIVYVYTGYMHLNLFHSSICIFPICLCYWLADVLFHYNYSGWVVMHFLFHLCTTVAKLNIINAMILQYCKI